MKRWKIIGLIILAVVLVLGTDFGLGYWEVFRTKTVEKSQINADRERWESSRVHVESKRQLAGKMYLEFQREKDPKIQQVMASSVAHEFANDDENEIITDVTIRNWITACKRGTAVSSNPF